MLRKVLASLLVVGLISPLSDSNVSAASDFWECRTDEYDGYSVISSFDITSVCVLLQPSDAISTDIYFFVYFQKPVSQYMFTSSGNWAGILIDTNADGVEDIQVQTTGKAYPLNLGHVAAAIYVNDALSKCVATTYANVAEAKNYIAFKFSRSCVNLQPSNIRVWGYADYIANDNQWFDFAPGDGWWLDFYPWTLANPSITTTTTSTTTTTTTTTTTVPKVQIPNAPSSVSISQLSESSLRITWLDNSTNEDGFLIQRNDTPVPSGTSSSAWPYKTATNTPTIEYAGLATNRSYCFSISSYNSAGSSAFTDSACFNLIGAVPTTQSPASVVSLSCDASRVSSAGKSVQIVVETGIANAGKAIKFEIYKNGDWVAIGTGRTSKTGVSALTAKMNIVGKKGTFPIRGSQGSRFICEGSLT